MTSASSLDHSNTLIDGVDYGPLAHLIGTWKGDKGVDIAPEPDGTERSPYYETLTVTPFGTVDNAESQTLSVVRYHQTVSRKSNDEVFHDQMGYWHWDASSHTILESFVIPRGVGIVAQGQIAWPPASDSDELVLSVATGSAGGQGDAGICQSQFMADNAATTGFQHTITVTGDTLRYQQSTLLSIYGQRDWDHKDVNTLERVG